MEGERGVLQDRVQTVAVEWRRIEAFKRVRCDEDEEQEGERDRTLNGKCVGLECRRKIVAEDCNRRADPFKEF